MVKALPKGKLEESRKRTSEAFWLHASVWKRINVPGQAVFARLALEEPLCVLLGGTLLGCISEIQYGMGRRGKNGTALSCESS